MYFICTQLILEYVYCFYNKNNNKNAYLGPLLEPTETQFIASANSATTGVTTTTTTETTT